MKIIRLKIKGYKNLDIDINHNSDIMAFIGLNGSGKSNVLEAVSMIFRNIYSENNYKVRFQYEIEFNIDNQIQRISYDGKDLKNVNRYYLPKKIVAIYSGEEKRLWEDCYKPIYEQFVNNIHSGVISTSLDMVFLSRKHWSISLLTLLLSVAEDNKNFTKDVLKIDKVKKIEFKFNKSRYRDWDSSPTKEFINIIDLKTTYALEELSKALNNFSDNDIFIWLYNATLSEMITEIKITFNEDNVTLNDLSEGEKKLLLLKSAFEFAAQENSLFMLDEPDSHVHLDNKQHIIKILNEYKHNRQFIITTHSPTLTQCIKEIDGGERVYILSNGVVIDLIKTKCIDYLAGEFWNSQQQTTFLSCPKKTILFVEGKQDKLHILSAWEHYKGDFKSLDFEIFALDGSGNILHIINGLKGAAELKDDDKNYIGLFDNDDAGIHDCNKTGVKYTEESNHKNRCFAITYPCPSPYDKDKNKHWTVENLLPIDKYSECYKNVVNNYIFEPKKIDDISKNIQKKVKNKLANECKKYSKTDFKNHKSIFSLLNDIVTPDKLLEKAGQQEALNQTIEIKKITEETQADITSNLISVYGMYKKQKIQAQFNKENKIVYYNGAQGKPTPMALKARSERGAPKSSKVSGWGFWKVESGKKIKELYKCDPAAIN